MWAIIGCVKPALRNSAKSSTMTRSHSLASCSERGLPFVGKIERLSFFLVFQEHECVRSVGFDHEIVGKERVRAIGDGQRFPEFSCKQGAPCHLLEHPRRYLAGLALTFCLQCLHFRRQGLLPL